MGGSAHLKRNWIPQNNTPKRKMMLEIVSFLFIFIGCVQISNIILSFVLHDFVNKEILGLFIFLNRFLKSSYHSAVMHI